MSDVTAAGRNGWMTPETLARHSDPRSAEEIEAVARAICREEQAMNAMRSTSARALEDATWHEHQGSARAAIRALRALDTKNNMVP